MSTDFPSRRNPPGDRPPRLIESSVFGRALEEAGIIAEVHTVERLVIVLDVGEPVKIHVQRFGDERLIDLAQILHVDEEDTQPQPSQSSEVSP